MSSLLRLQEDFQSYLLSYDGDMEEYVVGTRQASAAERLEVYAQAYRLRLLEALGKDFPALKTLLGEEAFDAMGRAYIDAYPSHHPSVRWFGRHLVEFLCDTAHYNTQPVLAEMAAFEWTQSDVFDSAEAAVITIEDLGATRPECWAAMRLERHPTVRRLDLTWNVPVLWRAIDKNEKPPQPQRAEVPVAWVLWRKDLKIFWRSLEVDEAWAIDACPQGYTFGEICEGLCEWIDEVHTPLRAASLIKQWISDGMIARIDP